MDESPRAGRAWYWPVLVALVSVGVVLGPSLVGVTSAVEARVLESYAPWDLAPPDLERGGVTPAHDTLDFFLPAKDELAQRVRSGDPFPAWNQYSAGGAPLAATPIVAPWSVVAAPYYVLPLWLAPAWVRLVGLVLAFAGTALFVRALGMSRFTAALSGLAYCTTGFMVLWANWPQANVAAWLPWLFWTLERIVARPRWSRTVPLAVVLCAMWFEGFPAVVVFGLLVGAVYVLVRLVAGRSPRARAFRVLILSAVAVVLGTALAAVQLVPFVRQLGSLDLGYREQTGDAVLPLRTLLTTIFPQGYGTEVAGTFRTPQNTIEVVAYVGVAVLCLAVAAVAVRHAPRGTVPGARLFAAGAAVTFVLVGWVGGPFLRAAQLVPFIDSNFIGRIRSVLALVVVVLAAIGFELLVQRRAAGHRSVPKNPRMRRAALRPLLVVVSAAWGVVALLVEGYRQAVQAGDEEAYVGGAAVVSALLLVSGACVAMVLWRPGRGGPVLRLTALVALPVLVAVQGAAFAASAWGTSPPEQVYPPTAATDYLSENLGPNRYAAPNAVMFPNANSVYGLRSVTGHSFQTRPWFDLVSAASGGRPQKPTLSSLGRAAAYATSPVLDRLGTHYWVADPDSGVIGQTAWDPPATPSSIVISDGETVEVEVPAGPKRGVVLQMAADSQVRPGTLLTVEMRTAAGDELGSFDLTRVVGGQPFVVPVAAEDGTDTTRATLSVTGGPVELLAAEDAVLAGAVIAPDDGGLRLVHVDDALVYERADALDRIRWAGSARVVAQAEERIRTISSGVGDDEVLLSSGPDGGSGADAEVRVLRDGGDVISAEVDASGAGWLVVADPLEPWWVAEVDGEPAQLLTADHAVVAVAVPEGNHRVTLRFDTTVMLPGALVSLVAAAVLVGLVLGPRHGRPASRVSRSSRPSEAPDRRSARAPSSPGPRRPRRQA